MLVTVREWKEMSLAERLLLIQKKAASNYYTFYNV